MLTNPYANVDWSATLHVQSCSHEHCQLQTQFDTLLQSSGLLHAALSNYYPSTPYYPLSDHFTVPAEVIGSPNAEHHSMTSQYIRHTGSLHLNGLGSNFSSGSPVGESPVGCDHELCEVIIPQIFEALQYSDGGGLTINHPCWSSLESDEIAYLLDLDSRVLGCEIYNDTCTRGNIRGEHANPDDPVVNQQRWDEVLKTGRRCWGFAVADHYGYVSADWMGRNILLVDELDEHKCLKAYRNGEFYAKLKNTALCFNSITFNGETLSVEAEDADSITFVVDGNKNTVSGNYASWDVTNRNTYIRVEAEGLTDKIFSNPIMLKSKEEKEKEEANERLIRQATMLLL